MMLRLLTLFPSVRRVAEDHDYLVDRTHEQDIELADLKARNDSLAEAVTRLTGELDAARRSEIDALKRMTDLMARAATGRTVFAAPPEDETTAQFRQPELPVMPHRHRPATARYIKQKLDDLVGNFRVPPPEPEQPMVSEQ